MTTTKHQVRDLFTVETWHAALAAVHHRSWPLAPGTIPAPLAGHLNELANHLEVAEGAEGAAAAAVEEAARLVSLVEKATSSEVEGSSTSTSTSTSSSSDGSGGGDDDDDGGGGDGGVRDDDGDLTDRLAFCADAARMLLPSFDGRALYRVAGSLPMSDSPSCEVQLTGPGLELSVIALRDLQPGDMLTLGTGGDDDDGEEEQESGDEERFDLCPRVPKQEAAAEEEDEEDQKQERASKRARS